MEINVDDDEAEDLQTETQVQKVDVVTDSSPEPRPSSEQPRSSTQQAEHFTELQSPNSTRAVSEAKPKSSPFRNSKRPAPKERIVQKKPHVVNERPEIRISAMDKFDKISERATSAKDDNFDHFGKYLASRSRTLPTPQALMLQQEMITGALNAHLSSSTSSPSPSNDQTQDDHAFSPQSEDTWVSELSAAIDSYTQHN